MHNLTLKTLLTMQLFVGDVLLWPRKTGLALIFISRLVSIRSKYIKALQYWQKTENINVSEQQVVVNKLSILLPVAISVKKFLLCQHEKVGVPDLVHLIFQIENSVFDSVADI